MADPTSVWPDRFGVDIKTTPFLANIFRRLVAICLKRGAVPIGGMATALPSPDPEVNRVAAEAIRADKVWEARAGLPPRLGRPHLPHEDRRRPFRKVRPLGLDADARDGRSRQLSRSDRGARGSHHARGHAAQRAHGHRVRRGLAQRPRRQGHRQPRRQARRPSRADGGPRHRAHVGGADRPARPPPRARPPRAPPPSTTSPSSSACSQEERDDILRAATATGATDDRSRAAYAEAEARYRKAVKIALRWIKNYTELDFRSLGSYTRADLDRIAAAPDAF